MKNFKEAPFLPTEVEVLEVKENIAKISAYPFESGYGITLAHPMRRLLMSSSVGYAPIGIKIDGAKHEFDSIRGVLEDVTLFILYLKKLRFKMLEDQSQITIDYSFSKTDKIFGKDLANDLVEVVNPEAYLCTINSDVELKFSIILQKSIGYTPSEVIRDVIPSDFIPMDAFFSPVREVIYKIEKILVEDNPNFEKVVFEVKTDGQITPIEAFGEAVNIMYDQMNVFSKVFDIKQTIITEPENTQIDLNEFLQKIDTLSLSARSFNSIDRAGIKYLGELVLMSEVEVKNIKNLGKKSFDEISEKLTSLNYPIGAGLPEEIASALRKKLEQIKG